MGLVGVFTGEEQLKRASDRRQTDLDRERVSHIGFDRALTLHNN